MHLQLFLEQQHKQNGTKLIGTKELENQQYIGQTPLKYVHTYMKMNFMHISSNLRLGGVSPIYWVKDRKKACQRDYMKLICMLKTLKNRYQLTKKCQVKKIYQMNKSSHGEYP